MYQPATRSLVSGSGPSVVTGAASGRLCVDVLAVLLEQLADVLEEGHVRLHVLGGPLVHRGEGTVRLRAAAVVLEEQVLRHGGLLVSWAAPVVALHLVSGAGQSFSTWNHSSRQAPPDTAKVPGSAWRFRASRRILLLLHPLRLPAGQPVVPRMKLLRRNLTRSLGFSSPAPPAQHSAITDAWSAPKQYVTPHAERAALVTGAAT